MIDPPGRLLDSGPDAAAVGGLDRWIVGGRALGLQSTGRL